MKKNTKRALLGSVISVILCCALLIGATFAWFTDTASTAVNKIQAGTLDVALEMKNSEGNWVNAEGQTLSWVKAAGAPAGEKVLWEPGCTYELPELRIVNNGNLRLKYKIQVTGIVGSAKLLDVIDFTYGAGININEEVILSPNTATEGIVIKGHMSESAGNEYQGLSIDNIGITVIATQATGEYDSINDQYDDNAVYPVVTTLNNTSVSGNITVAAGGTLGDLSEAADSPTAAQITVPAGAVDADTNAVFSMSLTDSTPDSATYEISLKEEETGDPITLSEPAVVTASIGTNLINVKVKHSGVDMTEADTQADGTYQYDKATGILTIYTKSFSPFQITYEFDGVASLNGTAYPNINNAIAAAKNGDTIVVLKDYTSSNILINLVSETEKAITIDLNGKTITYTGTNRAVQVAYAGANLTIKNGAIIQEKDALGVVALHDPTVNLEDITISGYNPGVYGYSNVTINMNKVTVNTSEPFKYYGAVYVVLNTELNMTECNVTSSNIGIFSENAGNNISIDTCKINSNYYGVYHNGSYAPCVVTVKNSQITDTFGEGIYISNSAGRDLQTLAIENCTISGPSAVEVKHTNATITNSTLIGTATPTASGSNNNGSCTAGYALAVTTNGVDDKVTGTVTVSGTKFYSGTTTEGESNGYVFVYQVAEGASVTIDGESVSDYNSYGGETDDPESQEA